MIKSESNRLFIDGKQFAFSYPIEKIEEFDNVIVIMFDSDCEEPNNVIGIDYNGEILWNINDILKADISPGITIMKKISNQSFAVMTSVGVLFSIDVNTLKILKEEYWK